MNEYLCAVLKDPSVLGSLLGAAITGAIALLIFWCDKISIRKERKKEEKLLKEKYWVFYKIKFSQIDNLASNVKFGLSILKEQNNLTLLREHEIRYDIKPIDEINKNIIDLKQHRILLLVNSPDLVPIKLYKLIEATSEYIDKMAGNFEGILATEEEDFLNMINLLDLNSQKLIELIKENF